MEGESQSAPVAYPGLGQQPVVKGLCAVTTIKMEGWKRRNVIIAHSTNEDGDVLALSLCTRNPRTRNRALTWLRSLPPNSPPHYNCRTKRSYQGDLRHGTLLRGAGLRHGRFTCSPRSLELSCSPTGCTKHLWMSMSTQSLKVLQKYAQHLRGR